MINGITSGTLTANGDTPKITHKKPHVHLSGTFGGGTATVYFLAAGDGTWKALSGAAYTAAADIYIDSERPITLKITLSGATNPVLDWAIR